MMRRLLTLPILLLCVPVFGQRLPRVVLPQHYDLTITPDLAGERFSGDEAITVGVQQPVTSVRLNAAEITFRNVSIESAGETQTATVDLDPKAETATFTVAKPLAIGPATIRISYDGILNRQLRGFYIGQAAGKKYMASQMESTDARRAFPSFDEPDMKATFRINVIADPALNVISNAAVESEAPGPAGKRTVRFAMTPRLSTYHIALIVGDFACISDSVDGIPLRICAPPDRVESSRYALNATKEIVAFYNRYFDTKYPFGKLDQIALADFSAGAMENPGAITYRETYLIGDEKTTSNESLRRSVSTMAHEIAHMWFGDLVTMRWWDDIWLNEGFATWAADKATNAVRPTWTRGTSEVGGASRPLRSDVLAATRPIHKMAETPAEIEQLFDAIAYDKTSSLLHMMEKYAGEEKFRAGINLYLRRNAYGNASASDFGAALNDATGRDLADVLSSYVNQPGVPLVNVNSHCEGDQTVVDLQQQRFFVRAQNKMTDSPLWTIPVCFTGGDCVMLRERQQTVRLNGCRSPLFANAGGRGYYLTSYGTGPQRQFIDRASTLTAAERVSLLRDQWYLVRRGQQSIGDFLDLASAVGSDRSAASEVLTDVSYIEELLIDPAQRPMLQRWIRSYASPLMTSLGWTPQPGDTPDDRELRGRVMLALGENAEDPATLQRATQLTQQWLTKSDAVDPTVVGNVIRLAAAGGDAKLYDAFVNGFRTAKDPRDRNRFLTALGQFRDPALLRRTLDLSLTDEVRSQDLASVLGGVMANPAGMDIGWQFLNDNWEAINKKLPPGHIARVISAVALSTCDAAWANRIKSFVETHQIEQARQATGLALERIAACTDVRTAQHDRLAQWINTHATAGGGR